MISGLNHATLAVSDLDRSIRFYTAALGLRLVAKWYKGAYLLAGDDWICLTLDAETRTAPLPEYTHLAFTVASGQFDDMMKRLQLEKAICWQQNHSEGESFYFLDPDGHKLEIHASGLHARLQSLRRNPPRDLKLFD